MCSPRLALALIAAACGLCPPGTARAQTADDSPPPVRARVSADWLSAVRATDPADTPLNPGNARLRIPEWLLRSEVRASLRLEIGSRLLAIVRPRVIGVAEWRGGGELARQAAQDAEASFTEAYAAWTPAGAVTISYGLQNFQWGPAELLAPNNRVFHEVGLFRDPLYYVPGRHLLRVNVSAGRQWSAVALAELTANDAEPFRAGERFAAKALVKLEYTTADGASYVGGTVGAIDGAPWWIGGYGSLALTEGLSVYADTSHTRGSQAWYPVVAHGRAVFARSRTQEDSWQTLVVAGGRYTFARGDDLRVEWMSQQAGWSDAELRLGFEAARAAASAPEVAPYLRPGLEFLGRRLLLFSLRTPELPPRKRVEVQTRLLHSITDGSRVLFVTGQYDAAGRLVLFASGTLGRGPDHGEFSRFARGSVLVGTSVTW